MFSFSPKPSTLSDFNQAGVLLAGVVSFTHPVKGFWVQGLGHSLYKFVQKGWMGCRGRPQDNLPSNSVAFLATPPASRHPWSHRIVLLGWLDHRTPSFNLGIGGFRLTECWLTNSYQPYMQTANLWSLWNLPRTQKKNLFILNLHIKLEKLVECEKQVIGIDVEVYI